jgi:hypothetical protein
MVTPTVSLEGTQVRVQTALDKTVGTVTTGTVTAGNLMYTDFLGGFTTVGIDEHAHVTTVNGTISFVGSMNSGLAVWVADFTQSAGNEVTGVRGFVRVNIDGGGATIGAALVPSTNTAGQCMIAATYSPIVGIALQAGTSTAILAYIDPVNVV